jgi:excisionase family DNA binding protein
MRTIDEAFEQIKSEDPATGLTRFALRDMVSDGKVPHVRVGRKILINYDGLLEALVGTMQSEEPEPEPIPIQRGVIRRISE